MKMWDPTAVTITEPASQSGAGKYLPIGEKIDQGNKKGETMLTNNFCWCQGRMRPFVVSESRNGYLKVLRAFQECTITFHSFEINQKMGKWQRFKMKMPSAKMSPNFLSLQGLPRVGLNLVLPAGVSRLKQRISFTSPSSLQEWQSGTGSCLTQVFLVNGRGHNKNPGFTVLE